MAGKRQGQKKYTCESVVCVWLTLHVYVGDQGDELDMKQCTRIHRVHTLKGHTTVKSSSWFIAFPCAKYCWGSKGIVGKRFGQSHTSGIQKNGAPDCHFSPYSAPPPLPTPQHTVDATQRLLSGARWDRQLASPQTARGPRRLMTRASSDSDKHFSRTLAA